MTFWQFLDKHFSEISSGIGGLVGASIMTLVLYGLYKIIVGDIR